MTTKDIRFLEIRHLKGPNLWTYKPVLEAVVDIGEYENYPSNTIPGYYERLTTMLPSLIEHRCSYGERGGFLKRLEEGTWPAHIMEHVTLELQNLAGLPGGFGRARETSTPGIYKVVVAARHEKITHQALMEARELILAAMEDRPFDVDASVKRIAALVHTWWLDPSTASIVKAADDRLIPSIRLTTPGNLVQLGYGAAMRRIWTSETDKTSAIAEGIAHDKDLAKKLLQNCGVPVPEGREVDTADDAWDAANDIGLPVAIKPSGGKQGRGVSIGLASRDDVNKAWKKAREISNYTMVERSIPGSAHRLLVIGGKMVAACRVGAKGAKVLRPQNTDADPTVDVTPQVHPDTAELACLAARIVGLDIAGVDLVVKDISRPLEEQGGAIIEVNAGPSLRRFLQPDIGLPCPVGEAIAGHIFPDAADSRIPVIGITGAVGKTTIAQVLSHLLQLASYNVAMACSKGLFLGKQTIDTRDSANHASARRMLMTRAVEAAIFENGAASILEDGLAYDRCQIGIVTHLGDPDGLETWDIRDHEKLFAVLRTQIDVVLKSGAAILNAEDAKVADMARLCDGEVLFYGINPRLEAFEAHRAKGGRSVYVRDGWIILASGDDEDQFFCLEEVPMTAPGTPGHNVSNLLAAVAAGWALDLSPDLIRTGIATYMPAKKPRTSSF